MMKSTTTLKRFALCEDGTISIEYSLIAVIVSIVIIDSLNSYAVSLNGIFNKVSNGFTAK
jgi:Flp pilus assembly pilin Flp